MIYDNNALNILYKDYSNINQKISLETKKGNLIRIKRGLYSNNLKIDAPIIANVCYEPSYISFEYALNHNISYHEGYFIIENFVFEEDYKNDNKYNVYGYNITHKNPQHLNNEL